MPFTRDDLLAMRRPQLAAALRGGHPIDPAALDDTAYRGISLGLPRWAERLSWKTFQKTFHRDPGSGALRGWNVRVEQRGLDAASVALVRRGEPFTFGPYVVRDPIVALNEGSVELLLGWSYVDLGLLRVPTPSFFLLEREGPLAHVVAAPRAR